MQDRMSIYLIEGLIESRLTPLDTIVLCFSRGFRGGGPQLVPFGQLYRAYIFFFLQSEREHSNRLF